MINVHRNLDNSHHSKNIREHIQVKNHMNVVNANNHSLRSQILNDINANIPMKNPINVRSVENNSLLTRIIHNTTQNIKLIDNNISVRVVAENHIFICAV